MRILSKAILPILACLAFSSPAGAKDYDPAPWLADLEQARQAFHERYANLDWLENERGVKVDALFDAAAARIKTAGDDGAVKAMFDKLAARIGDGHVEIEWPSEPPAKGANTGSPAVPPDLCTRIGYSARQNSSGSAQALPGYRAVGAGDVFPTGMVDVGGRQVGAIRIGVFDPHGYPELCRAAVTTLHIAQDKPCDDNCEDQILTWSYRRMTAGLEQHIAGLKSAGATALIVDVSHNGGGSEWVEAVARMMSSKPIVSEPTGFIRGDHWATQWQDLASLLRDRAKHANRQDRARLLAWADQASAAETAARTSCTTAATDCSRIAKAGYATGLVGSAPAGSLSETDWGVYVFSPAQYPYHDGVWSGPLIVLVDQETWSAAEEFAATLQDNKAAIILGARTGGAGCGFTAGGWPTTLRNSGAILKLPDCVRFRADGSNEVRGIIPDEVVGLRANDGLNLRARLIAEKLPAALAAADRLSPAR